MRKHWKYFQYVCRHKWFVFQEGQKLGVPLWQLLVHDWSKFLPDEWGPYADYFYGPEFDLWLPQFERKRQFDVAWLKHQHRSPHHWQYWVLREDSGDVRALVMPDKYRREMLADWRGAGRAIHGKSSDTRVWYLSTREGRVLHPKTQLWIEKELGMGGE